MTTERNDKHEPQVEVEELRDLDPTDESDEVRGGACQGPVGALGRGAIVQTKA